ncbi:hypothetical protein GCM10012287_42170 [Streptomyces daqingensis]|uniref:Uncharacterized protein n=1 Tax=Streptomyces daqingensis TaxID=1472640 RepID=A0ABQ2MMH8_9ACTN|nr:hypothetical protein GCM10012287_42170 [Streptomyces daqingensis]
MRKAPERHMYMSMSRKMGRGGRRSWRVQGSVAVGRVRRKMAESTRAVSGPGGPTTVRPGRGEALRTRGTAGSAAHDAADLHEGGGRSS